MKTCKSCKYWEIRSFDYGCCNRVSVHQFYKLITHKSLKDNDFTICTHDKIGNCELITAPNFGCIHHSELEEEIQNENYFQVPV